MWSIWFYFVPTGTAFEAVGYDTELSALVAINKHVWFQDPNGDNIYINAELKKQAVIKIAPTN